MSKQLPVRPSLEHLKTQAKDLLVALERGDAAAFKRIRQSLPAAHGATDARLRKLGLALHDAQSVVAREYGFASWAELKSEVTSRVQGPSGAALRELRAKATYAREPSVGGRLRWVLALLDAEAQATPPH
jgi:hypothetical protein